jgi:hypothetical protein
MLHTKARIGDLVECIGFSTEYGVGIVTRMGPGKQQADVMWSHGTGNISIYLLRVVNSFSSRL